MRNMRGGATVLELVMGMIIGIPIILILIDMSILAISVQVNDHAAREANRIAASGDPAQAVSRAQRVIDRIKKETGGFIANLSLDSVSFNPTNLLASRASMVPYGGIIQGSVTVKTKIRVTPFVVSGVGGKPLMFQSSQTCPISFFIPNTAGGQIVPP